MLQMDKAENNDYTLHVARDFSFLLKNVLWNVNKSLFSNSGDDTTGKSEITIINLQNLKLHVVLLKTKSPF